MLPQEEEEEGGIEGWLALPGSPRSRRLAHDMLDACLMRALRRKRPILTDTTRPGVVGVVGRSVQVKRIVTRFLQGSALMQGNCK